MSVLDASALIAVFGREPAAAEVESILRRPPNSISAVNLAEVMDWLVRIDRRDAETVRDSIDWLMVAGLQVEPAWLPIARGAASLRARYYDRTEMPLSLGDCTCLATAIALRTEVATTDPHLARVAKAVGVPVIALPNSAGQRPG